LLQDAPIKTIYKTKVPPWERLDDLDPFAGEDSVEVARELAVAVSDQETKQ
jgi:hypothetical protein